MGVLGADSRRTLIHPASQSSSLKMTFWQENYHFIKDVYDMRHQKMAEWMENVEKAIARLMAVKVYASAEFKRERDNFHALCKDLERAEVKKWLAQILEILMAERAKDQRKNEFEQLDALIKKHEELIPTVMKTQVMVDLYWKCYAYGDELKPHIEFLDGIMLSSTRDIAPSCVENVDELIERQEKSLSQLDSKRAVVKDLIEKGRKILENPDKPKFLEGHVQRIEVGWDDTKSKAQDRLKLLTETKDAWVGYAENNETIATEFEKAEDEIKKVKKRFNLQSAIEDLKKRQTIFKTSNDSINTLFSTINDNFKCMCITIPEDKKKIIDREIKAVQDKLEVIGRFKEKVDNLSNFCDQLTAFDQSLKVVDSWKDQATAELEEIKNQSGNMVPEDRVARTMDLQEDIAAKVEILVKNAATEKELLPQGDKVPQDAQDFKDELNRITKYVLDLQTRTKAECDKYSEDVKFWAEYRTGIKEFTPWLESSDGAAKKMTTHEGADKEVAALMERFNKVKGTSDEWVAKVDTLLKEWQLLDNTVTELNAWVAKDKSSEGENQFSLEKMESTLGELKNIFKQKEKLVDGL